MSTLPKDSLMPWLERALDLSYRRHGVISSNIANLDTPNYTPHDLDFREHLSDALSAPDMGASMALPMEHASPSGQPGLDGNTVDLDHEMVRLAGNRMFYRLASEVTNRRLGLLKYAIDEGGR